jgi:hypothetical protein
MKTLRAIVLVAIATGLLFSTSCGKTLPTPQAPDSTGLQPYIHYFTIVPEGDPVSPNSTDTPIKPSPTPLVLKSEYNLELVFFVEDENSGSIRIWKNNKDGEMILSQEWHFPDDNSKIWSNLMRPPNTTFYENRIELGKFEVGYYVLNIKVDNGASLDVDFKITS